MSRDSIFQQLRGHLAYLKLAAATEALPAHLDQARRDNVAHTPFLDELGCAPRGAVGSCGLRSPPPVVAAAG